MICDFYKLDKPIVLSEHADFMSSPYHFEISYESKHTEIIKNIIQNQNISKRKYIFVIRNASNFKQKHFIDRDNVVFIFLTKTLNNIKDVILSRATLLKLNFPKENISTFLKTHYDIESYDESQSLISIIGNIKKLKYEVELEKLLEIIAKTKNQLDVTNAIRDYCYKIFHMCIPLAHICKCILKHYSNHKKFMDILKICADCEFQMVIGSRDILSYESLFIRIWTLMHIKT